jgi:hypothetical protein
VAECFDTLKFSDAWTKYFWAYYCQLGTYVHHFQIFFLIFGTRWNIICFKLRSFVPIAT